MVEPHEDRDQQRQRDWLVDSIARIDERTRQIMTDMSELKNNSITRNEFEAKFGPVRMIAYGLVGLLLTSVVVAILQMVLNGGGG